MLTLPQIGEVEIQIVYYMVKIKSHIYFNQLKIGWREIALHTRWYLKFKLLSITY